MVEPCSMLEASLETGEMSSGLLLVDMRLLGERMQEGRRAISYLFSGVISDRSHDLRFAASLWEFPLSTRPGSRIAGMEPPDPELHAARN